ncbi:MAG: protein kinase [Deltaproteobacteria bacterium]|nr:protein kinase [Deltaproteobacteria bacterium]
MSEDVVPAPKAPAGPTVQLEQRLTLTKRLGSGRLGVVYAAVHSVLARRFAVKVLRPALTKDDAAQRRLRHMVRDASMVEHPSVVSLVDYGQLPDGRAYLTMDFVRGIQLTKALERDGRFPLPRAIPILVQLADALEAAHRLRVLHGDLKPNNILLVEQARGVELVRVHDFLLVPALAGPTHADDPLAQLTFYGSFDYLSPEQLSGGMVDGRADIYAFGAVAYRVLVGEPPFVGDPEEVMLAHRSRDPVPPSRRSGGEDLPGAIDAIILRCLEKDPGDRYKTVEEAKRDLQALLPREESLPFDDEVTGRWEVPPELAQMEEPLPESAARLRRLFYDTIVELAELVVSQGAVSDEIASAVEAIKRDREDATALAAQGELTENRFEDIRRELRERESALRYAIIDLNLLRNDQLERGLGEADVRDLDFQLAELERSLAALERQRRERFAALNLELQGYRDRLKAKEQQLAVHYRRLYAELDDVQGAVTTTAARKLYRRLERCRSALAVPRS